MTRVIFLCKANSMRSQMAEGLGREIFGSQVQVLSAGSDPTHVNPLAIAAMAEIGVDISKQYSKAVDDLEFVQSDLVVTLCADEVCPVLPVQTRRLHWPMPDPVHAIADGTPEQQLARIAATRDQLQQRIKVLAALLQAPVGPASQEFHGSIRVADLAHSAAYYAWLLNTWPKEWTHRYATFLRDDLGLNLVLVVADQHTLHHDTLYHLGIGVADRQAVIDVYHSAVANGLPVEKPPRTTWHGTPLHELWLKDPDGTLIEVYARLTDAELRDMPADKKPRFLVSGTEILTQ